MPLTNNCDINKTCSRHSQNGVLFLFLNSFLVFPFFPSQVATSTIPPSHKFAQSFSITHTQCAKSIQRPGLGSLGSPNKDVSLNNTRTKTSIPKFGSCKILRQERFRFCEHFGDFAISVKIGRFWPLLVISIPEDGDVHILRIHISYFEVLYYGSSTRLGHAHN